MTLADVERHDPYGGRGSEGGKHYLCPLPACADHTNARRHRSFSLNAGNGQYLCHRCDGKGILDDFANDRPRSSRREVARAQLARFFRPPAPKLSKVEQATRARALGLHEAAKALVPIGGTPGAAYLALRGLPVPEQAAGVARFAASWAHGGPAVVFPCRDASGRVVALQGRYSAWNGRGSKAKSLGPIGGGVFATPGALDAQLVAVAEAPIDALSLAACGLPAVALFGKGADRQHALLRKRLAFRTVVVATDNDPAGEAAGIALREALSFGTRCVRLPFPAEVKDANAWLLADRDGLAVACAAFMAEAAQAGSAVAPVSDADDLLGYALVQCRAVADRSPAEAAY